MAEPTVHQAVQEMASVASRLRAEADVMRNSTRRLARAYVVWGLIIAAYLGWAFVRTSKYVDPDRLATLSGDLATGSAVELIDDATQEATLPPSQAIRIGEAAVLEQITEGGRDLGRLLKDDLPGALHSEVEEKDRAILDAIARLPDAHASVAAAAKKNSEAVLLLAAVPDAPTADAFANVRAKLVRLASREPLSLREQAERRIWQAAAKAH